MYRFNPVGNFCMLALFFVMMFPVSGSCAVVSPSLMGPPQPVFTVVIPVLGLGNHWVPGRVEFEFSRILGEVAKPGLGVGGDRSRVFAIIPPPPPPLNSQQLAANLAAQLNGQFDAGALQATAAPVPGGGGAWQLTFGNDALQVTTPLIKGMMNPGIPTPDKYGSYTDYWFFAPAMPPSVTLNQTPEPTSIAIFGVLGLTLATMRRRKRQKLTGHITTVT